MDVQIEDLMLSPHGQSKAKQSKHFVLTKLIQNLYKSWSCLQDQPLWVYTNRIFVFARYKSEICKKLLLALCPY